MRQTATSPGKINCDVYPNLRWEEKAGRGDGGLKLNFCDVRPFIECCAAIHQH